MSLCFELKFTLSHFQFVKVPKICYLTKKRHIFGKLDFRILNLTTILLKNYAFTEGGRADVLLVKIWNKL